MSKLIGRKKEILLLKKAYESAEAALVAIYGRRRIGKTFLIKQYFKDELVFEFTGQVNGVLSEQLANFNRKLGEATNMPYPPVPPATWGEALDRLKKYLIPILERRKAVVFFDEFPWIDSHKSGFLSAFDYFWNDWGNHQSNLKIIICGSAASWMIKKVIQNKGGLHNRVTHKLRLLPFSLHETELFLQSKQIILDHYQLLQLYMVTGGVPHYQNALRQGESVTQFIDRECFTKDGALSDEFSNLYRALFNNFENHLTIVKLLAKNGSGLSRRELIEKSRLSSGGGTTTLLDELEESGFISTYKPFGKNKRETLYKLVDEYSAFYLKFIENNRKNGAGTWLQLSNSTQWKSWSGFAFEAVCLKHVDEIKKALGISGVYTEQSAWRLVGNEEQKGVQIDLLIDRKDNCINLCEMKFYEGELTITKQYAEDMRRKVQIFREQSQTSKTIFVTFITTYGVKENTYKLQQVQADLTMDVLFLPIE